MLRLHSKSPLSVAFSSIFVLFGLSSSFLLLLAVPVSSIKCDYSDGLAGIGDIYDLVDSKISVLGFEASVSYVSLPAGKC